MHSKRKKSEPFAYARTEALIDETDRTILRALVAEPRISSAQLARAARLSRPAVVQRVRRLEAARVILGWRVDLNPAALGLPISVYIRIRPIARQLGTVADLAKALDAVVECHRITGDDCFLVKAHVASIADLERLLDRFQPFGQTTTSVAQSSPVEPRNPPIPATAVGKAIQGRERSARIGSAN